MTPQTAIHMLRTRPWAAAAVSALLVAAYLAAFEVAPRIGKVARLVSKVHAVETLGAEDHDWNTEVMALEHQTSQLDSVRSALETSVLLDGASAGAVLYVHRLAGESKFALQSVAVDRSAGLERSLLVEGRGDYHAIGRLVDAIESGDVTLLVRRFAISSEVDGQAPRASILLQPPTLDSASSPEPR